MHSLSINTLSPGSGEKEQKEQEKESKVNVFGTFPGLERNSWTVIIKGKPNSYRTSFLQSKTKLFALPYSSI